MPVHFCPAEGEKSGGVKVPLSSSFFAFFPLCLARRLSSSSSSFALWVEINISGVGWNRIETFLFRTKGGGGRRKKDLPPPDVMAQFAGFPFLPSFLTQSLLQMWVERGHWQKHGKMAAMLFTSRQKMWLIVCFFYRSKHDSGTFYKHLCLIKYKPGPIVYRAVCLAAGKKEFLGAWPQTRKIYCALTPLSPQYSSDGSASPDKKIETKLKAGRKEGTLGHV